MQQLFYAKLQLQPQNSAREWAGKRTTVSCRHRSLAAPRQDVTRSAPSSPAGAVVVNMSGACASLWVAMGPNARSDGSRPLLPCDSRAERMTIAQGRGAGWQGDCWGQWRLMGVECVVLTLSSTAAERAEYTLSPVEAGRRRPALPARSEAKVVLGGGEDGE
jgi:hypothetical protein